MSYTKKNADRAFRRLAQALGKDVAEGDNFYKVGAWELSYNSIYGGCVIEEIVNEGRGITHPLIPDRMHPYEFCLMCEAIIKAMDIRVKVLSK